MKHGCRIKKDCIRINKNQIKIPNRDYRSQKANFARIQYGIQVHIGLKYEVRSQSYSKTGNDD